MDIWNTTTDLCNRTLENCTTKTHEDKQSNGIYSAIIIPVVIVFVVLFLVLLKIRLWCQRRREPTNPRRNTQEEISRMIQNENETLYLSKYNANY